MGFYDTAKVTKITNGCIWINIILTFDGHGTIVQQEPDLWTDLVELNFVSTQIIQNTVTFWDPNNKYWRVYDEDNTTTWNPGNFDDVTYAGGGLKGKDSFSFNLSQNYPNPFNPSTFITYEIGNTQFVTLKVYDILGSEITTLVNEHKMAGHYLVEFNGVGLTSGVYFYKLQAGAFIQIKKMVLIK